MSSPPMVETNAHILKKVFRCVPVLSNRKEMDAGECHTSWIHPAVTSYPVRAANMGNFAKCLSSVSQRELISELIWAVLILSSIRTFRHCLNYSNTVILCAAFNKSLKTHVLHKKIIRPAANNVNYGYYGHQERLKCLSHVFQLITSGNHNFLVYLNQVRLCFWKITPVWSLI